MLLHGVPAEQQPSFNVLMGLRRAITSYLVTLSEAFITPGDTTPPLPELFALETKGIQLIQGETLDLAYEKIKSRRRLLLSLIKDDGWNWNDLQAGSYNHEMIFTSK